MRVKVMESAKEIVFARYDMTDAQYKLTVTGTAQN